MQRIAALALCWCFLALLPLMVGSTRAMGAARHLEPHSDEHIKVEQEMQADARSAAALVGWDGTWVCRAEQDGAVAGGGSGAPGTGSR